MQILLAILKSTVIIGYRFLLSDRMSVYAMNGG